MGTREQEIEARFEQFWKEKKDLIDRISPEQNKSGAKNDSGIHQQSATDDQKQSNPGQPMTEKPKPMKYETFREVDELVAIVYDGLYRGLESHTFAVESDPILSSSST